jgi:hypothetical protein
MGRNILSKVEREDLYEKSLKMKMKDILNEYNISKTQYYTIIKEKEKEKEKEEEEEEEEEKSISVISNNSSMDLDDILKTEESEEEEEEEKEEIQTDFVKNKKDINKEEKLLDEIMLNPIIEKDIKIIDNREQIVLPKEKEIYNDDELMSIDFKEKKNLRRVIKSYIKEFSLKLKTIIGDTALKQQKFLDKINVLEKEDLEIVISNIKFEINSSHANAFCHHIFYNIINGAEIIGSKYCDLKLQGLTIALQQNNDINDCLREMACDYDISNYVSVEYRLISAICLTAYQINNKNMLSENMKSFMDSNIDNDLEEKYKSL